MLWKVGGKRFAVAHCSMVDFRNNKVRDRQSALDFLKSASSSDRLSGARYFLRHSSQIDREALDAALQSEKVPWVKSILKSVLADLNGEESKNDDLHVDEELGDARQELYSRALNETTSLLLHEIAPHLGFIKFFAAKEVADYETSKTKRSVDALGALLRSISILRSASNPPQVEQIDLSVLIRDIVSRETSSDSKVQLAGTVPFLASGDSKLLDLAITNGLRNALEACEGLDRQIAPIVINWDSTDRDYWVSIIDDGKGFSGNAGRAFGIGTTSKSNHFGMGLPIAQQALATIGGLVRLNRRDTNGAQFELRWPKATV
jgi:signal transduction histidine kinase